jgi:hypothetical protein
MNILKKWWFWAIIVILILLFPFIYDFTFIPLQKNYILGEIEEANYCDVDSDCAAVLGNFRFGCNIYVNLNEVERISGLISSYKPKMSFRNYMCQISKDLICVNGKCGVG